MFYTPKLVQTNVIRLFSNCVLCMGPNFRLDVWAYAQLIAHDDINQSCMMPINLVLLVTEEYAPVWWVWYMHSIVYVVAWCDQMANKCVTRTTSGLNVSRRSSFVTQFASSLPPLHPHRDCICSHAAKHVYRATAKLRSPYQIPSQIRSSHSP